MKPILPRSSLAWVVGLFAALATMPGRAVDIPNLPLQTGAAYPPANVMFILDDSGSMTWRYMYNTQVPKISYVNTSGRNDSSGPTGDNISSDADYSPFSESHAEGVYDRSYATNTIYYNPSVTYLPWMQADGTRMTGGTTYDSVYTSNNFVGSDSGTVNLSWVDAPATFYVPVSAGLSNSELGELENYYRYQILENGEIWRASFKYSGNSAAQCDGGNAKGWRWRNCTRATPTGRSEEAERNNFATWYSYHRTRIKVAKAGASEAFGQLGSGIRVGYDSIWGRSSFDIPVNTDGGVFRGTNRSTWFSRLHGAQGNNGTPLKGALQRAGKYFSDSGAGGPWDTGDGSLLSCRQNFAILTTDGYWNSSDGYDGTVNDADATQGALIVSEDGKTSLQYKPVTPYRDDFVGWRGTLYSRGDTLADIANYYWKRDLVSTLANDVPTSTADPAFWQHMVTFGVSIGLRGRLDPRTDLQSITNGSKHWGDPTDAEDLDRIDDLWHASVNGHGNFVTATNPSEFVQGLIDALATVAQRLGSASNVTANSTSFQTDTRVYQASYESGKWTGELAAYEVSSAGVSSKDEDGDGVPDAAWKASQHIPAYADRDIFTSSALGVGNGTTFPTAGQITALDQSSRGAANGGPTTGAQNAAYVAGSQALETRQGGTLRDRDTLLGDIANSSPMYVQDNEMIYVGANDGMLHAFSAVDRGAPGREEGGEELFAYVPAGLDLAALATLSDPQYGPSHRYFVDGPVVVSSQVQTGGKNYLLGTLGRGGKGIFALDVTDPEDFGADDVLWDLTGTGLGADMGQVLGEPLIVTLNNGATAAIVGNGINSTNGHSVLFVLDIDTGSVIRKFDTGSGGDNGLSAPRGADVNADGTVDYVYAGDLNGNVWKFDLSGATSADWRIANGGSAMFHAEDADGTAQPITTGLAIARDPGTSQVWVFVGTGSFIESGDIGNTDVQSMYGLIDNDSVIAGRGELVERDILVTGTQDGRDVRGFEASATMPADKKGWFIDLDEPSPGERVVSNPRVRGTVLLFASMVPPQEDTCDAGGTGYINALDAFNGTSLGSPYFDVDGDGDFDDDDRIAVGDVLVPVGSIDLGVGMPTLPTLIEELLVVGGSKGTLGSITMNPQGGGARRISWREILRD